MSSSVLLQDVNTTTFVDDGWFLTSADTGPRPFARGSLTFDLVSEPLPDLKIVPYEADVEVW